MPTRTAMDGPHTVFTDHRISRVPARDETDSDSGETVSNLVAWREPSGPLALRNLGLANMELGGTGDPLKLSQGSRQVMDSMKFLPPDPSLTAAYRALGDIYASQKDMDAVARTLKLYLDFTPNNMMARKGLAELERRKKSRG